MAGEGGGYPWLSHSQRIEDRRSWNYYYQNKPFTTPPLYH